MTNQGSRIEEIRHEERQLSAKLKTLTAELNRVRHQAEEARQKLASLEAERLLLERKRVKVTICPDPRVVRRFRSKANTADQIKAAVIGLTPDEREELFQALLA